MDFAGRDLLISFSLPKKAFEVGDRLFDPGIINRYVTVAMMIAHIGRKGLSCHVQDQIPQIHVKAGRDCRVEEQKERPEHAPIGIHGCKLDREIDEERSEGNQVAEPKSAGVRHVPVQQPDNVHCSNAG